MQGALTAKRSSWCHAHRTGTTFSIGVPTLSFFLYAIRYAWGVGDASDTAVPFLDPYRPIWQQQELSHSNGFARQKACGILALPRQIL